MLQQYRFRILIIENFLLTLNSTLAYYDIHDSLEYRHEKLGFEIAWGLRKRIVSTKEAINANEDITTRNCSPPTGVFDLYTLRWRFGILEAAEPSFWFMKGNNLYTRKCDLSKRKLPKRMPLVSCKKRIYNCGNQKRFNYNTRCWFENKGAFLFSFLFFFQNLIIYKQ